MIATSLTTFDDLRLHVHVHGPQDAPLTVVLAHCWTADTDDWRYQVRDLLSHYGHGVRIVTWDHRGHGRSDPAPRADCTIANLARDMGDVIDTFAPAGPLVVAGHSIGGMTMMALPKQRPDVVDRIRGALFVSTSSGNMSSVTLGLPEAGRFIRSQLPRALEVRARLLSRRRRRETPTMERYIVQRFLFGDPVRARDVGLVVDQIINCPPATMRGFYEECMRHERVSALAEYAAIPTRVLVGSQDVLTPPTHARRIVAATAGARLLLVPQAGHMLPLERPEFVSAQLVDLIDAALPERVLE